MRSAQYSNGTMVDKRNGPKGMLGTRIIHVLCPWWKSVFAAMVGETIFEGGGAHFSSKKLVSRSMEKLPEKRQFFCSKKISFQTRHASM